MNVVTYFSIAIALISLIGGGVGFLDSKRKDSTIATLAKDNLAVKDYNQTLETQLATIKADRDGWQRRYEDAKEMAQGSPELKKLTKAITLLHKSHIQQNKLLETFFKSQTENKATP